MFLLQRVATLRRHVRSTRTNNTPALFVQSKKVIFLLTMTSRDSFHHVGRRFSSRQRTVWLFVHLASSVVEFVGGSGSVA